MGKSTGSLNFNDLLISPNFRNSDWQKAVKNDDWSRMVEIFEDRIEGRFLKPIRLIASDKLLGEFSGFSILALDCLLIETLNQFQNGLDETEGEHKKAFWNFFRTSLYFKDQFTRNKAYVFYNHFRCGLLHQAQTKKKSVVRVDQEKMIQSVDNDVSAGLIVDRSKFHEALENEISSYKHKLRIGGEDNSSLRKNFVIKMNFVCGL